MHTNSIFIFLFYFSICFWLTTSTVWRFANIGVTFCFSGCSDCTFNLCTPTRPVILPGNEKLVLAPYHTFYPSLEEHLQGPWGIPIEPNLWNDPLVLGKKAFGDRCAKQSYNKGSVQFVIRWSKSVIRFNLISFEQFPNANSSGSLRIAEALFM